jgi:hypothetical protein
MAKKQSDDGLKNPEKDEKPSPDKIENWASKPRSKPYKTCEKFYKTIRKAFENRQEADTAISEYWNIYNAIPDGNQKYNGNDTCYIPAVRDCIRARSKRALKQNFPVKYKHVDAIGTDGVRPTPQLSLLEHYIRATKLKSICRSVYIAGDVTGQWNIYVDWMHEVRDVSGMIKRNPVVEQLDNVVDPEVEEEEIVDDKVVEQGPTVTDFATEDMIVIPPTCNDIEKAAIVCQKLRLSKHQIEEMVKSGTFVLPDGADDVDEWMETKKTREDKNPEKARVSDAGIQTEGTNKFALIFEATARIDFGDGKKSLAYIYFAGESEIIGLIKAPQWGQKRPQISAPVDRLAGSFHGQSPVEAVKWMQWSLNDTFNMGQDSAMYSNMPITMIDPEKNPNWATLVIGLASVWPVDPNTTKFAQFPPVWKEAVQNAQVLEQRIQQAMDVNPMMMGQMPAGRKNANAMGAQQQESSVPILDHAERFEEEILTPLLERMFEYDCQFRDEEITILTMGEIGVKAQMQKIPPNQWGNRYFFQWVGTEYVQNMQHMQQQISTMNVLRGIPPQQLNGRKLDIAPILEILTDNVFGSEMSGRILIDDRNKFTIGPETENEMMINGIPTEVHEADNDVEHLQAHHTAGEKSGDPAGLIRNHMQAHMQQLQKKRQMAQAAMQPQPGQPGVPGGGAPGVAGTPRPGAQPAPGKAAQQPAGAIHPDQMAGATPRG